MSEIRDFIFENLSVKHLKRKDLLLLASKLIEKITDPHNAKEHYESFLKKKNRKSGKQSEIFTYQPKPFENPNIVDIKLVLTEHPQISLKLSKTIRQGKKVRSNSSLYSDIKKCENFLNEKKVKITKQEHAFKGYASTYNVEISNFLTLNHSSKILNLQLKVN